ncbi:MAG: hypothetical protein ABSD82_00380 [Solirubrobacteraceae bacterium]|jgi:FMN phosphatase YigB (HAD superfamily)
MPERLDVVLFDLGGVLVDYRGYRQMREMTLVDSDEEVSLECVASRLPVPADQVLFIDDSALNVEAAARSGFTAVRVSGVANAREALAAAGVPI